ncbi:MAG: M48 family metallopeptidase [Rhodobacteraceae bacterium]|nr:M48 family metallopeptidase [Paracoccaceae bacterium]
MTRVLTLCLALVLAACVEIVPEPALPPASAPPPADHGALPSRLDPRTAADNFAAVVASVGPVAERECRARAPELDCAFRIVVDDRPGQPPNAFQTVDRQGRPVIGFTLALIADARNRDELAFILGHEAGHHIAGHLPRTQQSALAGALILGTLASVAGGGAADVQAAQDIGATVGARRFSKEFELEADMLGTIIAYRAGYDPARGAAFFDRIPDPGNRFLGTHPPNAERRAVVQNTLARLR